MSILSTTVSVDKNEINFDRMNRINRNVRQQEPIQIILLILSNPIFK
jgi:hypothetical protein